jgi:hypothetical protein
MGLWRLLDRFFAWVEGRWSLYNLLFGTGGAMSGVAGGWSAWASDAFHVYGPAALVFGFFAAALGV